MTAAKLYQFARFLMVGLERKSMSEAINHNRRRLLTNAAMSRRSERWVCRSGFGQRHHGGPVARLALRHTQLFGCCTPVSVGYGVIIPYLRGYGSTRFLSDKTIRNAQQTAVATDVIAMLDALKIDRAIFGGFDWGARTATIVIHNYRWRMGLAEGEPKYDELERRLAAAPVITVPISHWKAMPTVLRIPTPVPTPANSRANTRTVWSKAASDTTCRKKRLVNLRKPSSTWTTTDGLHVPSVAY